MSVNKQPGALDARAAQGLGATGVYTVSQGGFLKEALTDGCCENKYLISDGNNKVTVNVKGKDQLVDKPLFIAKEVSPWYCRCCCNGRHPATVQFYHSTGVVEPGQTKCSVYAGHNYPYEKDGEPFMALERDGCDLCRKWPGMFICCAGCCADQAWMHFGNPLKDEANRGKNAGQFNHGEGTQAFAEFNQTTDCCVPIVAMGDVGTYQHGAGDNQQGQWGYAEGPQFFGGCLDLCTNTTFGINGGKTKSNKNNGFPGGERATIQKDKPQGCAGQCKAICSDLDNYKITINDSKMPPEHRAAVIGEAIHLDYLFFEQDRDFCAVEGDANGGVCYLTLCTAYCRGALIPIQICIPYSTQGG